MPYDSAIPLLGILPDKTITQKDTCTPMFIATLQQPSHGNNLNVHHRGMDKKDKVHTHIQWNTTQP